MLSQPELFEDRCWSEWFRVYALDRRDANVEHAQFPRSGLVQLRKWRPRDLRSNQQEYVM